MSSSTRAEVRDGLKQILPVLLATFPVGALYGAIATDAGLTLWQTLGMSAAIYGGASQFAALQMIGLGAPVWAVVLSIFALNFRHVLYSASIGRHLTRFAPAQKALAFFLLVDPLFAEAEARAEAGPLTKRFYFTYALLLYAVWVLSSAAGALFGRLVQNPRALALDFVLPAYFLALVMSFRRRGGFWPVVLISAAASAALYATLGPPWHVTLGALAGILYAALAKPAAAPAGPEGGT